MQRGYSGANLEPAQQAAALRGIKGMIPVGGGASEGRPFLDFILSGLADAGCREICLVVGPEYGEVRDYYTGARRPTRLALEFAVQDQPLGTADAVLATESFAGDRPVLVVNADNLYPVSALSALQSLVRAGLVGFRRSTLLRDGNFPAERIRAFALIETDASGLLTRIVEKPDAAEAAGFGGDPLVSMNAWLLPPTIYPAGRAIHPSPRGEFELQDAVRYTMEHFGERFIVVESNEPVLDLSSQGDIAGVAAQLHGIEPRP